LNVRIKAVSIYNDAYSGNSQDIVIKITTINPKPIRNNYGMMIGAIIVGILLCLFSAVI
jgi:hypothetical protein